MGVWFVPQNSKSSGRFRGYNASHLLCADVYQRQRPKYCSWSNRKYYIVYSRYMMQVCDPGSRIFGGSLDLSSVTRRNRLADFEGKRVYQEDLNIQLNEDRTSNSDHHARHIPPDKVHPGSLQSWRCNQLFTLHRGPTCGFARKVSYLFTAVVSSSGALWLLIFWNGVASAIPSSLSTIGPERC